MNKCTFCKNEVCYQDEKKKIGIIKVLVDGENVQVCKVCYEVQVSKKQPDQRCDKHSIWFDPQKGCKYCNEEKIKNEVS